ncbi:hypothetical protein GH714_016439 [Hevea brasiliensis]|uniref:Uncharacterized protein n=1 Tax=Hevea brasiliensis TaxID=3981 RepID=A0A6A6KRP7_HEVBR|nr:hypothetical protein GH714_016439 [Hevea brasiliensis]
MEDGRKTNASLSELDTHHMTALEISVPKASILPEVSVFRNLERFKICVGCTNEIVADRNYAKVLQLRDDASDIKETGMKVLMGKAEVLNLIEVINMKEAKATKNSSLDCITTYVKIVFKLIHNHISFDWPSLERFTLDDCPKMEKLCSAIPDSSTLKNSIQRGSDIFIRGIPCYYWSTQFYGRDAFPEVIKFEAIVANDESDSPEYEVDEVDDESDSSKHEVDEVDDESDSSRHEVDGVSDVRQL